MNENGTPAYLKRVLRRKDLAAALGVSPRTIARLDAEGEGPPSFKLGQAILYDAEAAERWRQDRTAKRARVRTQNA